MDATLALPLCAASLTYLNLEIGFAAKENAGGWVHKFKYGIQTMLIVGLPFLVQLPQVRVYNYSVHRCSYFVVFSASLLGAV